MAPSKIHKSGLGRQSGQVMPMTAILMVAVLLSAWVMYDSGVLMTERMKLQNTADNVAYSSSALVSRDLNFAAYTNRAMVANQVIIGQVAGLSSWAAMGERFAKNVDLVAKFTYLYYPLGVWVNRVTKFLSTLATKMSEGADKLAQATSSASRVLIPALSISQQLFHVAMSAAVDGLSDEVLAANDPDAYQVGSSLLGAAQAFVNWGTRIDRFSNPKVGQSETTTNQRFEEFAGIVRDSRDPFTARRSYEVGAPFSWGISLGLISGDWSTTKRGGSDFRRKGQVGGTYKWEWSAMDTLGFEIGVYSYSGLKKSCVECMEFGWGWGNAHVLQNVGSYYLYPRGDGWGGAWENFDAAKRYDRNNKVGRSSGLQPFYAFEDDSEPHTYGPPLVFLIGKDNESMSLTADLGADGDNALNTETAEGLITAAAKAQPYYSRSTDMEQFARQDGNFEYGNLYNPFWQPRLVKLNNVERAAMAAAVGISEAAF